MEIARVPKPSLKTQSPRLPNIFRSPQAQALEPQPIKSFLTLLNDASYLRQAQPRVSSKPPWPCNRSRLITAPS